MRKKIFMFLILILASNDIAYGKNDNKANLESTKHKKFNQKTSERNKRSANIKTFYQRSPSIDDVVSQKNTGNFQLDNIRENAPFWGARGRRESTGFENSDKIQEMTYEKLAPINKDNQPLWANRGRRYDSNSDERSIEPWNEIIKRQGDEDPFWGSRGRRNEDDPFWGSRGRRLKNALYDDDDTPFWANRGRRKMSSLYDEPDPFWANRGKKNIEKNRFQKLDDKETFWENNCKREHYNDDIIKPIISEIGNDSDFKISRLKNPYSFWSSRGRDSTLKYLFTGAFRGRGKPSVISKEVSVGFHVKPSQQKTLHDNRIYAEEPHYILIERSSRSSMEDDPYIITRGKKFGNRIAKAVRGRRGALEDIVKSVQKDPYYIARGKKNSYIKFGNTIMGLDNLNKVTVCRIIQSSLRQRGNSMKREINDPERDRRAILKKLADKLQEDPYFVSRGKKDKINDDYKTIKSFVADIAEMCS